MSSLPFSPFMLSCVCKSFYFLVLVCCFVVFFLATINLKSRHVFILIACTHPTRRSYKSENHTHFLWLVDLSHTFTHKLRSRWRLFMLCVVVPQFRVVSRSTWQMETIDYAKCAVYWAKCAGVIYYDCRFREPSDSEWPCTSGSAQLGLASFVLLVVAFISFRL